MRDPVPQRGPAPGEVASPCTSVCRMDDRSGWCVGCARTLDEIAAWSSMNDAQKLAVWDSLAARHALVASAAPERT